MSFGYIFVIWLRYSITIQCFENVDKSKNNATEEIGSSDCLGPILQIYAICILENITVATSQPWW